MDYMTTDLLLRRMFLARQVCIYACAAFAGLTFLLFSRAFAPSVTIRAEVVSVVIMSAFAMLLAYGVSKCFCSSVAGHAAMSFVHWMPRGREPGCRRPFAALYPSTLVSISQFDFRARVNAIRHMSVGEIRLCGPMEKRIPQFNHTTVWRTIANDYQCLWAKGRLRSIRAIRSIRGSFLKSHHNLYKNPLSRPHQTD